MTTYRGNRGNLLQHWTFCEVVSGLAERFGPSAHLAYFDAHGMAPLGNPKPCREKHRTAADFDLCRKELPGFGSLYEQSWSQLTGKHDLRYPSSAVLRRRSELQLWLQTMCRLRSTLVV